MATGEFIINNDTTILISETGIFINEYLFDRTESIKIATLILEAFKDFKNIETNL